MRIFNNLKLGVKILLGFFIVSIIAIAIGIIGIVNINKINDKDTELYEKMTVPMNNLYNITESFQKIRVNIRDYILAASPDAYVNCESKISENKKNIDNNISEIEKTMVTSEGKSALEGVRSSLADYNKVASQIIACAKENKDDQAVALINGDGVKANIAVENSIAKLTKLKINLAKTTSANNTTTTNNSDRLMIWLIILGVIFAFGIGTIITISITRPIRKLVECADKLSVGDVDIEIESASKDEIGILMKSFKKMVNNIKEQAITVRNMALGDLNITLREKSDKDVLGKSLISMDQTVKSLLEETKKLIEATKEGKLQTRGDADAFNGGWRELVIGMNEMINAFVNPISLTSDYVDRISKGNMPPKITDIYKGDFNLIKNNLNECIDNISALILDANMLSQAAMEGRLSTRADASKHSGDYKLIIDGVNNTLDSVIGPLNVAADYVDKISKGNMPPKITDSYNGDFNIIKNNLNECIDNINALVADANMLSKSAIEGKLSTRADASRHNGDYKLIVEGVNSTLDSVIGPLDVAADYVDKISKGNMPPKITDTYNGEFNVIKNNLNLCIDNINALVLDANMLSEAGVEGKLSVRADASRHNGDFRKIIEGVNRTLDAVIEPVRESSAVLQEMSNGNLKVRVQGDYKGDHADIKNALNNTLDALGTYVSEISEILGEMSNSNLKLSINNEYKGDFSQIKDALNFIIQSFNNVFTQINNAADQVSSGANQVSDGSQALSQGTTEQASAIEELTSSIGEVAAQTKQNAINASQASELALNAKDGAALGNSHMKEMLKSMDEINESSANISKIIKVIDDIAFQTNILALNAAVEAARAGQHGKGFAVVAEEVRNLAARSANAAKETTDLIEGSIRKVESGTKIANGTAEALDQIVEGVSKAAALVGDIAVASNEQATSIAQINKGVEQVSDVVQTNSATAQQSAAASEELSSQASMLKNMVGKFKLKSNLKGGCI